MPELWDGIHFQTHFSIQIPALGNSHFSGRRPCKRGKLAASGVPFLGSRIMAPPPASWRSNRKKWRSDLGGDQVELTAWWLNNHLKTYESQGLSHILWKIKNVQLIASGYVNSLLFKMTIEIVDLHGFTYYRW